MTTTYCPSGTERDPAFEAEIVAYLNATGAYKVTRSRPRVTRDQANAGPALSCAHCGQAASRATRIGRQKPKGHTVEVGVCEPCYRFGPRNRMTPRVSADPERYARLYRVWRRAHHRYARRYAALGSHDMLTRTASMTVFGILVAMDRVGTKPNTEGVAA